MTAITILALTCLLACYLLHQVSAAFLQSDEPSYLSLWSSLINNSFASNLPDSLTSLCKGDLLNVHACLIYSS